MAAFLCGSLINAGTMVLTIRKEMDSMCHILITSPGGIPGEAVARSLRSRGLDVRMLDAPSARKDTPGFLRALTREIRENRTDMILPVFFPEIIAENRDRFPGICIPLDSAQKLRLLDNKCTCCRLAESLGIPQPRRFSDAGQIDSYPVVFKRPFGQGGDSVYFPRSEEALKHLLQNSEDCIVTEFIEGYDVSVDAIRWGDYFSAASYRVLEPTGKGVSIKRESISAPVLEGYARKILDATDFRGVCGFDFRIRSADGEPFFLECNPRFSGGIESAISSGFDIPYVYFCLAGGLCSREDPQLTATT